VSSKASLQGGSPRSANRRRTLALQREKTSFASNASGDPGGQPKDPRLVARWDFDDRTPEPADRTLPSSPNRTSCRFRPSTECASSSRCQISKRRKPFGRALPTRSPSEDAAALAARAPKTGTKLL